MALSKKIGGWGLKNIYHFGRDLPAKSPWNYIFDKGLWGILMHSKYLKNLSMVDWIQSKFKIIVGISNVWNGLVGSFSILGKWLDCNIGDGKHAKFGCDPWIGGGDKCLLSEELRIYLSS
jgi:hypothetical protein